MKNFFIFFLLANTLLVNAQSYTPLPYIQNFDSTWINVSGTHDVPDIYWHNEYATGDSSWRRDDDGVASAGWQNASAGYYPPSSDFNPNHHSARFHSSAVPPGVAIRFDLYVNYSTGGTNQLLFDYQNQNGSDLLTVLFSTDGGASFNPVISCNNYLSVWQQGISAILPFTTSSTCVIRFQATADNGLSDIGLDYVQVGGITSTGSITGADHLLIYPNPVTDAVHIYINKKSKLQLFDVTGNMLLEREVKNPVDVIDLKEFAEGVYFLKLFYGTDFMMKKIIKSN